MDDGRLPGEMSVENIAKQLAEIKVSIDTRFGAIDTRFNDLTAEMRAGFGRVDEQLTAAQARDAAMLADINDLKTGFGRVDEQLNAAKIRDEEMHGLLKFSLEAREGLRESMENRFDVVERKHDEEIGLLKDVLRHVTAPRASR